MGKNSARRGFRSSNNKSGRARDFAREGEILDDAHNRTARAVTGAAEHRASCVTTTTTPAKQKSTKFTTKSEEKLSHLHQQTHRDSPGSVLDAGSVLSASAPDCTPASASAPKSQLQLDLELDTDTYISEMEAYLKEHMGSDSPPASTSSFPLSVSTVSTSTQTQAAPLSAAGALSLIKGNGVNSILLASSIRACR